MPTSREVLDPGGERGGAQDVVEDARARGRRVAESELRLEEEYRHLLAERGLADAVVAAADSGRDAVRDERGDEGVELLAPGTSRKSDTHPLTSVPTVPSGVVTITSWTVPGGRAGMVAVREVLSGTETPVAAAPPTVTVAGPARSVPEPVTTVPPAAGPDEGVIENRILCENSEVFRVPVVGVAVAETRTPASVEARLKSNVALPAPSVVICSVSNHSSPSRNSRGKRAHGGFA